MNQNKSILVILLGCSLHVMNTVDDHRRQKRFVFYPGSVLQLAVGLAIPADIQHRIIYTNYGIMINYELPTNLSTLLPVSLVEQARSLTPHLNREFALKFGLNNGCWKKFENWATSVENKEDFLMHGLAQLILREIESDGELLEFLSTTPNNVNVHSGQQLCLFESLNPK